MEVSIIYESAHDHFIPVAANIESGLPVTAPGVSKNYPEPKSLVTEDCVKPANAN